jgi:hypothetical protein
MEAQAKQQVVERVKQASNILVTVSNDPSVDQLAACIGLTLLLNKVNKHATAVFSGVVPSTLEFLQPEKTLETNTDSLRDFIISLDKAKADKLRYKVEDDFVRIFITPYRTALSEKDLQFSQGEYNVEVVMALGVTDQAQLDAAITAHGKILHDATVISINSGAGKTPELGQINWQEPSASSLSEMIVSVSEAFGSNLIDNQMATAFLTGIIAETDRFSNEKTSPKVMTMAAQLMAAGANQQLIVSKLEPEEIEHSVRQEEPLPEAPKQPADKQPKATNEGTLNVKHDEGSPSTQEAEPGEIHIDQEGNIDTSQPTEEQPEGEGEQEPKREPIAPPEEEAQPAPQEENKTTMPGSHAFLEPKPVMENPFKSDPDIWEQAANKSADPLMNDAAAHGGGMIGHAPDVKPIDHPKPNLGNADAPAPAPAHEDRARNAVEKAFESASDNPVAEAFEAIDEPVAPPKEQPPADDMVKPPPFPPPFTPSPGVVIPPPYNPPGNEKKSTNDNTL